MPSTCTTQSVEIAALRERVAQLEAEVARGQESRQRFRTLAVHSPTGIFQCDLEGNSLFVNSRYAAIAGVAEHEANGQGWLRTLHREDREEVLAALRLALDSDQEFVREFRFQHDDQTLRWVSGRAVPLSDDRGRVTSYLGNVLDITQRKQAEDLLRESEQRFRLLSNSSPVGIFVSDKAGNVVYTNSRLQAIYGYEAHELAGLGFARVFHPEDYEQALANWMRVAATTDQHDLERRFIKGGELRQLHVRSAPMISPDGTVVGRVGTVEDITDRRRAEDQLRKSEELYRVLAEYSTDVISTHTAQRVCRYVSPACRTLFGYEPEELIGRDSREFVHPDDWDAIAKARSLLVGRSGVATVTYRMRRKDGQYIWLEGAYKTIPAQTREGPGEIIGVSRDITVRMQAAQQLRESEARMRSVLNTATDGIITVNDRGVVEQFNLGAQRLFGYSADEVLGQPLQMLIPAIRGAPLGRDARGRKAFRGLLARVGEVVGLRKDGTKCELEMRVGATVIAGRSIFTGILHDITQRKRTEEMLRESEKLAATGRIAARIAHEINNPLAGIRNSFLLIEDAIPRGHPYYGYLARIEREINRIARIVRQMFDLYRPGHVLPRKTQLGQTIRDIVALLSTIAPERGVKLEVDTTAAKEPVSLPEDSMRQVLYNIIVNAIEASPAGGVVTITAALRADNAEITVADEGAGIPLDLRPQIYEPFFTTKNQSGTGGLGLGLSISRGIVEALQGTLDFESSPDQGTTFFVRVPIQKPDTEATHA
jgi:two-component system sporulation sensor kinase A